MLEQGYQKNIVKKLEECGAYVVKVVAASKKGVPDILCCYRGRFIAIEVKMPTTMHNTTKLQDYNLKKIVEAGGFSIVAYEFEQVLHILEEIDEDE